jgi:hypothetical protein
VVVVVVAAAAATTATAGTHHVVVVAAAVPARIQFWFPSRMVILHLNMAYYKGNHLL